MAVELKESVADMPQPGAQDQSPLVLLNAQLAQLISDREALWEKTGIPDDPDYPVVQTKEALLERIQALELLETKFTAHFEKKRSDEYTCLKECRTALQLLSSLETKIALLEKQIADERAKRSKPSGPSRGFEIHEHIDAVGAVLGPGAHLGSNYYVGCIFGAQEGEESVSAVPVLDRLRKSLQETYKGYARLERLFDEGDAPIAKSFINLALIKETEHKSKEKGLGQSRLEEKGDGGGNDDGGGGKSKSPTYVDERLASHEQLYAVKEPLALTELFEPKDDTPKPNKVLVLGRAGIGKSILCQYLATQWASEEKEATPIADCLQKKFDAVFWVKLREVAVGAIAQDTLIDVLDRFCLSGPAIDRPTKKELTRYLKQSTDKVLFILDGYDEITNARHLDGILEELSTHTHLLLTSRPIVIEKLGNKRVTFDRRLENMGFLNENIEAYVHQFMASANQPEQAPLMLNFLKSHAGVWGIAHIPINLELLSWLWLQGELTLAEGQVITLSKLYQIIVNSVQDAYVRKELPQPAALALNAPMESKAEGTVVDHVNTFLEYLAFHAMEKETLFISGKNISTALLATLPESRYNKIQREQLLKSATDKLGFLRTTGQGGKSQLKQTHYFIHLSFQEFYAARYVTRILTEQSENLPSQQVLQCIQAEKYTPRYQLMLWMSAGLLYQHGKPNQNFSALTSFEKAIASQPRDLIGYYHRDLVMHCLDECEADSRLLLYKAFMQQHSAWLTSGGLNKYSAKVYLDQLAHCPVLLASRLILEGFLQRLKDEDYTVRRAIIETFGRLKNPSMEVMSVLLSAMKDEREIVACAAIKALGQLNNPSNDVTAVLLEVLKGKQWGGWDIRHAAEKALGQLSNSNVNVVAALLKAVKDKDENVRSSAVEVLGKLKNPSMEVMAALLEAVKDNDVRSTAVEVLGDLKDLSSEMMAALLGSVKDENEWVRKAAVKALGKLNNPSVEVVVALLEAVQDEEKDVKSAAAEALGKLQDLSNDVIAALLEAMKDEDWEVRLPAVEALGKLDNPTNDVITALLVAVKDEDEIVRRPAVEALGKLNNPNNNVITALLEAAEDRKSYVRNAAVEALGRLKNPSMRVMTALLMAVDDEKEDVRRAAVKVLGKLKDPSNDVIAALLRVVKNEYRSSVTQAAVEALDNLKSPGNEVMAALLVALEDEDRYVRMAAVEALGKLKNPNNDVVPVLLGAMKDGYREVRDAAVWALENLSSKQHVKMIVESLASDTLCAAYFGACFDHNYLLCIDHLQGQLILRLGYEACCVPMSPERLQYLEKQIIAVAKKMGPLHEGMGIPLTPAPGAPPAPSQANNPARLMSHSSRSADVALPHPPKKKACLIM